MLYMTDTDPTPLTLPVERRGEHWYVLGLPDAWDEPDTLLLIVEEDKSLTPITDAETMRIALLDLCRWHHGIRLMRQRQAVCFMTPFGAFTFSKYAYVDKQGVCQL